ncbi:MAG TPA: class I SAM-dependent methyltransferase [Candidatus Eisenbacteria bacterium]
MDDHQIALTERYNREAASYRDLWAPVLHVPARALVEALRGPAARVVDLGSGVGSLLPTLKGAFPQASILGIDQSIGMLSLAPPEFPRAVMDASRMALADRSVDVVVMAFMLFHLPEPLAGLREARRVLRGRGRVGTLTWVDELRSPAITCWSRCLDDHGAPELDPATKARHEPVNSTSKVIGLLRAAGFEEARAWDEEIVARFDLGHFYSLKTSIGADYTRFMGLEEPIRARFLEEVRRRLEALAPADFHATTRVVFGVGRIPGND